MPTDNAVILTPAEVRNIRRYVQHKFADLPQDKHADIVADAVRRIVYKRLPDFAEDVRNQLTSNLIRTALVERSGPVGAEDIVDACLTLDMSDSDLFEPFHVWVERQLSMMIDADTLREAISSVSADATGQGSSRAWGTIAAYIMPKATPFQPIPEGQAVILPFIAASPVDMPSGEGTDAISVTLPLQQASSAGGNVKSLSAMERYKRWGLYGVLSAAIVSATLAYGWWQSRPAETEKPSPIVQSAPAQPKPSLNELPDSLRYREVDRALLLDFLESKNSMLTASKYLDPILDVAEQFDIDPLLLIAITGQEQAFVPKSNKRASEIINNPFNVFHSWQDYNTTIRQSAEIASRTINRLSKNRPAGTDPFTWINREYAEDPLWSDGVRSIWNSLNNRMSR